MIVDHQGKRHGVKPAANFDTLAGCQRMPRKRARDTTQNKPPCLLAHKGSLNPTYQYLTLSEKQVCG